MLKLLVKLFEGFSEPDYVSMAQCLVWLKDFKTLAAIFEKLVASSVPVPSTESGSFVFLL